MKLSFQRDAAVRLIDRVASVVKKSHTIAIMQNVLLEAAEGRLTITGTNGDMEATASIQAEVAEPGALTLSADTFGTIVRNLPGGANISMSLEDTRVHVNSGRSRYKLPWLNAKDYPRFSTKDLPAPFECATSEFARLLDKTAFAALAGDARPILCGVHLTVVDGEEGAKTLRAVATDIGYMAIIDTEAPEGCEGFPSIVLPSSTVAVVSKLLADGEIARLAWTKGKFQILAGGVTLTSKLVDGQYVEYLRAVPTDENLRFDLNTAEFLGAMGRAAPFPDDKECAVAFSFGGGEGTLTAQSQVAEEAQETFALELDAEPQRMNFSGRRLRRVAQAVEGETFSFAKYDRTAIIRDPADAGARFIITSLRGG